MYKDCFGKWIADLGNKEYKNPILFSDYSDPDVIKVGDDFFMVASSFTYFPGLPVLHSKDLVNWEIISYAVEKMPFETYDTPQHGKGIWAPSIRHHEGVFYVSFGDPDEGVFLAKTTDPFGKWDDVILVHKAKGWIDTCPFWDEDGKAYLIRGVAKSRIGYKSKLFLHQMSSDGTKLLDEGVLVFDGRINHPTIEGPKMYKRNGYYYIFAPAGGVQQGWQMVARSKNIYGPYEHKVVLWQGDSKINGPHQGGLVDLDNGESYFMHFQDLEGYGRITHLQPARWTEDGWIEMGVDTNKDHIGEPVQRWKMPIVTGEKPYVIDESDNFDGEKLGLKWQWQAHFKDNFYSIENGKLKLNALSYKGENISFAPNVLCQLMKRPNFEATTKVDVSKLLEKDSCGLVITGGSYYGLRYEKGYIYQVLFELEKDVESKEVILEKIKWDFDTIYFKLKLTYPCKIECFVSKDGIEFEKIGKNLQYKVSRKSWVGGKIGLFAVSQGEKDGGYASFEFLKVE